MHLIMNLQTKVDIYLEKYVKGVMHEAVLSPSALNFGELFFASFGIVIYNR